MMQIRTAIEGIRYYSSLMHLCARTMVGCMYTYIYALGRGCVQEVRISCGNLYWSIIFVQTLYNTLHTVFRIKA